MQALIVSSWVSRGEETIAIGDLVLTGVVCIQLLRHSYDDLFHFIKESDIVGVLHDLNVDHWEHQDREGSCYHG